MAYTVLKNLVSSSKYSIKCPYSMTPKFIVIHNTANDASAVNEIAYMIRNDLHTSFHYAVDDINVVQGILESRNSWNAGDGTKGNGNRNGIAIEICYSKSGGDRFIKAEQNAVLLIVDILKRYGWGIDKVKKHQDFSGKYCPHRTLDMGWDRFLSLVKNKMANYPFEQGSVIYPTEDVKLYNTAGYADQSYITIKKDTKCYVIKYHDVHGLYMALGASSTTPFEKAWTKEFGKFTLTPPAPPVETPPIQDPTLELRKRIDTLTKENKGLTEALGASQGTLAERVVELATARERVKFLEDTLLQREKELNELQGDYDRILEERNNYEDQYNKVVTELNELKEGRDTWIQRLADVLHKLFGMK